jgi:acyl-CoA thioesterase-2
MPEATRSQADLGALFSLTQDAADTWVGESDLIPLPQLFGGQLVAQSILAASYGLRPEQQVHSVHTAFLRGGTVGEPVRYVVTELVTGRSRATRRVDALQGDRLVCSSLLSADVARTGIDHARPAPPYDPPSASVPLAELADEGGLGEFWDGFEAIEVRVSRPREVWSVPHSGVPPTHVWMRPTHPLPDDPVLHRAAVAYASDLMLLGSVLAGHGVPVGHERTLTEEWWGVSLDHSLWFAPDVRGDDWLLFEHTSPLAHGSRTLVQAAVFDTACRPVAQVAQEALVRRAR